MALNDTPLSTPKRRGLVFSAFALFLSLVLIELFCQGFALFLYLGWNKQLNDPRFYYRRSSSQILGYELKPGYDVTDQGHRLHINSLGVREDNDNPYDNLRRVAIVGDSVVFGLGTKNLDREQTIPGVLQDSLDPSLTRVKFFNCAVPGYSLREFPEFMGLVVSKFRPSEVVYVLNPNDFALRDTRFEGADNGLYRMFVHPFWKTPWMIDKLIYRAYKGGKVAPNVHWYLWTFNGTKSPGFARLREMASIAASWNASFEVVILPAGSAYAASGYGLEPMRREIEAYLTSQGIQYLSPVEEFQNGTASYIDNTDHLTVDGTRLMAGLISHRFSGVQAKP